MVTPQDSAEITRLMELITEHVGVGKLDDRAQARLAEIDRLAPESCRFKGGTLHRVMTLDADQARALRAGRDVMLEARPYSCWTRNPIAVMNLARRRFEDLGETDALLLLQADFDGGARGFDIEAMFRLTSQVDGVSWNAYGGREQEIVLPGPAPRITPGMVAGLWDAGDFEAIKPRVGEDFFGEGDDILIVDEVLEPENGGVCVRAGGRTYLLHWEFGALSGVSWEPGSSLEMSM